MLLRFCRRFHVGIPYRSAEGSNLAKLRKKTGYTFANCKKALQMHNDNLKEAETWLHQQAQALGWSKADKLAGRATAQGLIALKFDAHHAALVEINCETDFVARNDKFQAMAAEAADACFRFAHTGPCADGPLTKMRLDGERLGSLHTADGKILADRLALTIGTLGENAILRRAECWKAASGLWLSGYTHPSISVANESTGKYGGILAFKCENLSDNTVDVGRRLCQHIVGMNPPKIGKEGVDEPTPNADDETCLIFQEYISDPTMKVSEILKENHIEVYDFVRFECGQNLESKSENEGQPLEHVQTCQ